MVLQYGHKKIVMNLILWKAAVVAADLIILYYHAWENEMEDDKFMVSTAFVLHFMLHKITYVESLYA